MTFERLRLPACATLLFALVAAAAPQGEYDRAASARDYVQFLVLQLDQWTRSFPHDYNAALMRPPVEAARLSEGAKSGAGDLRDTILRLGVLSNAKDILTNGEFRSEVARSVALATQVNQAMSVQRFPSALQSDWDQIRTELNNLARIYKVETLPALEPPGAGRGARGARSVASVPPGGGVSGYIVDQQCAARGKGMWTNAACVARCVREGDKVVLVTEEGQDLSDRQP